MRYDFTRFRRYGSVGIAPEDFVQERGRAIERGQYTPPMSDPEVWVSSREECERILKNPLDPRHNRVRRIMDPPDWNRPKYQRQTVAVRKPFPHVDADQADCVHRLMLILEDMGRHPEERTIVNGFIQPETRFDMRLVYSGTRKESGGWKVKSAHAIGLAALDPWFLDYGLCPSFVSKPREPDSLDICGLMVRSRKFTWRRWDLFKAQVFETFGIGEAHWELICDSNRYQTPSSIKPAAVLERLRTLTENSHVPKFTGAAMPD